MCDFNIWNIIFNFCDFKTQIDLLASFKFLHDKLFITDLYNIDKKYLDKLTNNILQKNIFRKITKLNVGNNPDITDISQLTCLKILNANGDCGIDQDNIQGLNLVELYVYDNIKINDVSRMNSLKILDAGDYCKINQNGIQGLNLIKLDVWN